jgi:uncharacterized protein YbjT (DUF2867 family)
MKSLLIFGAGSGVGAKLLDEVERDYRITLVIRNPLTAKQLSARGFTVIEGDAADSDVVERACLLAGAGATIVSTMGGEAANYRGHRLIIDSAEKSGINRMLLVTSLGCGDSWPTLSERAKNAFGQSVREKSLAESWLQTSRLDYCILRPGGLKDGPATHQAQCYQGQEVHGLVQRHDVALIIVQKLQAETLANQIFAVIDPNLEFKRG